MGTLLRDFAPHVFALFAGGIAGSVGVTWLLRSARGRTLLGRTRPLTFTAGAATVTLVSGALALGLARNTLTELGPELQGVGPLRLLVFGLLVGVPLSLPGMVLTWSEARSAARAAAKKRDFVPTKDDRRAYAADLARQIEEISPRPRTVVAKVAGDGGRVLRLEGDIEAAEGERLTAALRADLSELGFKRVEGGSGSSDWWSRV